MTNPFSHIDGKGHPRMVDVSEKSTTKRRALAEGWVKVSKETITAITKGNVAKGAVLDVARLAGIMGARRTSDLIPLCHPIPIDGVEMDLEIHPPDRIHIRATVVASWRTGVEMEALTAVCATALTIYDMIKALDRQAEISGVRLLEKSGGRSGEWIR